MNSNFLNLENAAASAFKTRLLKRIDEIRKFARDAKLATLQGFLSNNSVTSHTKHIYINVVYKDETMNVNMFFQLDQSTSDFSSLSSSASTKCPKVPGKINHADGPAGNINVRMYMPLLCYLDEIDKK